MRRRLIGRLWECWFTSARVCRGDIRGAGAIVGHSQSTRPEVVLQFFRNPRSLNCSASHMDRELSVSDEAVLAKRIFEGRQALWRDHGQFYLNVPEQTVAVRFACLNRVMRARNWKAGWVAVCCLIRTWTAENRWEYATKEEVDPDGDCPVELFGAPDGFIEGIEADFFSNDYKGRIDILDLGYVPDRAVPQTVNTVPHDASGSVEAQHGITRTEVSPSRGTKRSRSHELQRDSVRSFSPDAAGPRADH